MVSELTSAVAPVFHGWEARIDNHTKLAKLFVSTEDYCACNCLIASELISGVDHVATFYKVINASGANQTISENALDRLKDIEITSIKWGHSNFETFVKKVNSLKGQKTDRESWKTTIEAASEDAKARTDLSVASSINRTVHTAVITVPYGIVPYG
jgi:hypothetical protein